MSELEQRLRPALAERLDHPDLWVQSCRQIFGGASRHTYAVEVGWGDGGEQRLIVRVDPEASLLESNREVEFELYRAMAQVPAVPVPPVLFDEADPAPLGRPFFVMAQLPGQSAGEALAASPHRAELARQYTDILAAIATCDWAALGLDRLLDAPEPQECWRRELGHWEAVLDRHDLGPQPVTRATCRWLRRNPPPPAQRVALVHGDYRAGNLLFEAATVTAVLDWEMAHLGDPVEDLTWGMIENWRYDKTAPQLVGGLQEREPLVARWQQRTGLRADPHAVHWWFLLNQVKAIAIWLTGGHQFATGASADLLMPLIPWLFANQQEIWMLDALDAARAQVGP